MFSRSLELYIYNMFIPIVFLLGRGVESNSGRKMDISNKNVQSNDA